MNDEISYSFEIKQNEYASIELMSKISKRLKVDFVIVSKMLKANIVTPKQLSILSGKADSTIRNLMRPVPTRNGMEARLQPVYPWPIDDNKKGIHEDGPVFILFDEKCAEFLMETFK